MEQMLCEDARQLAGAPHERGSRRLGHRWGTTQGKIGFHGGKIPVRRPRLRSYDGHEVALPTWTAAQAEDWLGRWAMNLMLINVSTRKLKRAVRLACSIGANESSQHGDGMAFSGSSDDAARSRGYSPNAMATRSLAAFIIKQPGTVLVVLTFHDERGDHKSSQLHLLSNYRFFFVCRAPWALREFDGIGRASFTPG